MPRLVLPGLAAAVHFLVIFKKLEAGVVLCVGSCQFFTKGELHPLQPLLPLSAHLPPIPLPSSKPKRGLAFLFPFSFPPLLSLFVLNLLK